MNSKENEEILKNLNNDSYNKIKNAVINAIYFDIEHPNLSDYNFSQLITNFNFNDLPISKKINNYFQDVINIENEDIKMFKLKNFLNKNYFKHNITNSDNLLSFLKNNDDIQNNINYMNQIYEENKNQLLNFEITSENLNFENEYFNDLNYLETDYELIGNLKNFETFVYKYNVYNDVKLMVEAEKFIEYWREVYSDGNTFYRIFMFKLIENYIINNDINQILILFSNIMHEDYCKFYDEKNIYENIVFGIFELIVKYMKNNETNKAYYLFLNAYKLKDGCFDDVLICYLKCVIYENLKKIYDELKNEKLINDINIENIKKFYIEPDFIVLYLIPYLFNVNLKLFWIDGDFSNPIYGTINFSEENEDKNATIKIGSFYNTYFPLYDKNETINNNIFNESISKIKNIKQHTFILKDKIFCQKCYENTDCIFFIQKKFKACYNCLTFYLNYQIKERAKNFQKEKFCYLEYYLRNIQLNDLYSVNDCEFIEIFDNINIYKKIVEEICCLECKKIVFNLNENEIKILKCSCIYCEECFNKKKINKNKCQCGKKLILDKNLYGNKDENNNNKSNKDDNNKKMNVNKSLKNLNKQIATKCLNCLTEIISIVKKENKINYIKNCKYYKIKIEKENNNLFNKHIICINCYKKLKKINLNDDSQKDENLNKIQCNICNQIHFYKNEKNNCNSDCCCLF